MTLQNFMAKQSNRKYLGTKPKRKLIKELTNSKIKNKNLKKLTDGLG